MHDTRRTRQQRGACCFSSGDAHKDMASVCGGAHKGTVSVCTCMQDLVHVAQSSGGAHKNMVSICTCIQDLPAQSFKGTYGREWDACVFYVYYVIYEKRSHMKQTFTF